MQEPGDLVIIPPNWWHQVYHLEPSIAVAFQFIDERGKERVFAHIINWCKSSKADAGVDVDLDLDADEDIGGELESKIDDVHSNVVEIAGEANRDRDPHKVEFNLRSEKNTDSTSVSSGTLSFLHSDSFQSLATRDQVSTVISLGLRLQHGNERGKELMKELIESDKL